MSEFSYNPNDPNNPTSEKEVNTNINNSSDYLKTTSSLPKPPVAILEFVPPQDKIYLIENKERQNIETIQIIIEEFL